ncbi:MAG: hypothetical protein ABI939_07065 [Anaerolineaceae bacterium]
MNDKLFILNAGTTNENREPQGAQDVVNRFRTNERVYGWVQIAGATANDRLDVQVYINDAPQQPQVVAVTKTAGIQVFPLNPGVFPAGYHRWSVTYATRGGQNREFTVA